MALKAQQTKKPKPWPSSVSAAQGASGGGLGRPRRAGLGADTVFPEAGDGEFRALLDIWFPEKKPLPTAFLVDTSEEALLLPDWLKLRMIRSEVPRLVDAGRARGHVSATADERTARGL